MEARSESRHSFEFVVFEGFVRVNFRRYFSILERCMSQRCLSETALRPHQSMGSKHISWRELDCGPARDVALSSLSYWTLGFPCRHSPLLAMSQSPGMGALCWPSPSLPNSLLQEAATFCLWEGAAPLPSKKKRKKKVYICIFSFFCPL